MSVSVLWPTDAWPERRGRPCSAHLLATSYARQGVNKLEVSESCQQTAKHGLDICQTIFTDCTADIQNLKNNFFY